ncbi:MAG: hypothetical protein ABDH28_06265 [Brevinematia bacterium]
MFIKNIVLGVVGMVFFPLSYFVFWNLNFVLWGIVVSGVLIFFYFVNVYVIGKRRTFFTITSSWLVILSLAFPFNFFFVGSVKLVLLYLAVVSFSLSWMMVFFELFASETFKGH